jgi:hypothetical protein
MSAVRVRCWVVLPTIDQTALQGGSKSGKAEKWGVVHTIRLACGHSAGTDAPIYRCDVCATYACYGLSRAGSPIGGGAISGLPTGFLPARPHQINGIANRARHRAAPLPLPLPLETDPELELWPSDQLQLYGREHRHALADHMSWVIVIGVQPMRSEPPSTSPMRIG